MNKNELTESVVSWKQKKPSATSFYTSSLCTALLKKPSVLGTTRFADFKRNKRTTGKKKKHKTHTHQSLGRNNIMLQYRLGKGDSTKT